MNLYSWLFNSECLCVDASRPFSIAIVVDYISYGITNYAWFFPYYTVNIIFLVIKGGLVMLERTSDIRLSDQHKLKLFIFYKPNSFFVLIVGVLYIQ